MCNRIGNFINLLMSCVMALVVSVSVAGAEKLTPDTGIDPDTPVQKEPECRCNNGMTIPCDPKYGRCNLETCTCEPMMTWCDSSTCKNSGWLSCANGNYYKINRECQDNICTPKGRDYSCPTGTYGSLANCNDTCTVCPQNAACFLGLNSRYRCDLGFYDARVIAKKELCLECPANAVCGASTVQCNQDYYRQAGRVPLDPDSSFSIRVDGYVCVKCPNGAKTKGVGATNKTECYLPENTSVTPTYEDSYGKFEVSGDCFWTQ